MTNDCTSSEQMTPSFPAADAHYIQCARRHTSLSSLFYRYRRTLELDAVPAEAVLRLTGCSQYAVYVNGTFVNRGPLVSGKQMMTADAFDITKHLTTGKNVIAVQLIFYPVGHFRLDIAAWQGAGFVGDLLADDKLLLTTDSKWKSEIDWAYEPNTSKRCDWMPLLEIYDARRADDWTSTDYDDSSWQNAIEYASGVPGIDTYELRPKPDFEFEFDKRFTVEAVSTVQFDRRPDDFYWFADHSFYEPVETTPDIALGQSLDSVEVMPAADAFTCITLNAEQYVLGRPSIAVTAPAGTTIDFIWAERLSEGNRLLDPIGRMANWARYICKDGKQTFTFWSLLGFKKLQLIIHPDSRGQTVKFHHAGAERQWSMRCDQGSFSSSDERYDKLWQAGAWTAACVTTDHHCDNTFREHQPWSGDQEWTKMGVYVSQGVHPITQRQLRQLPLGQKPDGRLLSPYPSASPFKGTDKQGNQWEDLPDHAAGYIHSLWRNYVYTGNRDLLERVWPALLKQLDYWNSKRSGNGLVDLSKLTDSWIWVDWTGMKDKTAPVNGLIGCALWSMIRIANTLNEDATELAEQYALHRDAFINLFWSEDENLFLDLPLHQPDQPVVRSQHTNAFAACADMLPDSIDRSRLATSLANADGSLGPTTPPMAGWVFTAMEALGEEQHVIDIIERRWLCDQIINELGTVPEFWPEQPGRLIRSWAQGGSPFISWALTYYILGLRPTEPGHKSFVIKPTTGKLSQCAGTAPSPFGPIRVQWQRTSDSLDVQVDHPENTQQLQQPCNSLLTNATLTPHTTYSTGNA